MRYIQSRHIGISRLRRAAFIYIQSSSRRICEYMSHMCVCVCLNRAYLYLNGVFFRFTNYETTFRVWKIKREVYEKKKQFHQHHNNYTYMHAAAAASTHTTQSSRNKKKRDEGVPISDILMHFFKNYLMNTNSSLECKLLQSFVVLYYGTVWRCVRIYAQELVCKFIF